MAVTSIAVGAYSQISDGSSGIMVQFRPAAKSAEAVVRLAASGTPTTGDWLEVATGDLLQIPAGDAVYACALNGAAVAVTRDLAWMRVPLIRHGFSRRLSRTSGDPLVGSDAFGGGGPAITGTGPVLAALMDGDALSGAVTWGSYSSTAGEIADPTTKEMQVDGGSWETYAGETVVAEGEVWQVRETVSDGTNSRTFTSGAQEAQPAPIPVPVTLMLLTGQSAIAQPQTYDFRIAPASP